MPILGAVTLDQHKKEAKKTIQDIIKILPPDEVRDEIEKNINSAIDGISPSMQRIHCKCGAHVADVPLSANFSSLAEITCRRCKDKHNKDMEKLRDYIRVIDNQLATIFTVLGMDYRLCSDFSDQPNLKVVQYSKEVNHIGS